MKGERAGGREAETECHPPRCARPTSHSPHVLTRNTAQIRRCPAARVYLSPARCVPLLLSPPPPLYSSCLGRGPLCRGLWRVSLCLPSAPSSLHASVACLCASATHAHTHMHPHTQVPSICATCRPPPSSRTSTLHPPPPAAPAPIHAADDGPRCCARAALLATP